MYPNFVQDLLFDDPMDFQAKIQGYLDIGDFGSHTHIHVVETLIEAGEALLERYNEQVMVSFVHANADLLFKSEICASAAIKIVCTKGQDQRAEDLLYRLREQIEVVEDGYEDAEAVADFGVTPAAPARWQPV